MNEFMQGVALRARSEVVAKILANSVDKPLARRLLGDLAAAEASLQSNEVSEDRPFAQFREPYQAIMAFLEDRQLPATRSEIVKAVIDGGWRWKKGASLQEKKALGNRVGKSVDVHLTGTGLQKERMRKRNGLVGLYHWPDEMFDSK